MRKKRDGRVTVLAGCGLHAEYGVVDVNCAIVRTAGHVVDGNQRLIQLDGAVESGERAVAGLEVDNRGDRTGVGSICKTFGDFNFSVLVDVAIAGRVENQVARDGREDAMALGVEGHAGIALEGHGDTAGDGIEAADHCVIAEAAAAIGRGVI